MPPRAKDDKKKFSPLFLKRPIEVIKLHGSISYGDGARCWENAFQAFGSAKFFWGRTQTGPPAWTSQLRCSQGRAPHDMVCPPPPSQKS